MAVLVFILAVIALKIPMVVAFVVARLEETGSTVETAGKASDLSLEEIRTPELRITRVLRSATHGRIAVVLAFFLETGQHPVRRSRSLFARHDQLSGLSRAEWSSVSLRRLR